MNRTLLIGSEQNGLHVPLAIFILSTRRRIMRLDEIGQTFVDRLNMPLKYKDGSRRIIHRDE